MKSVQRVSRPEYKPELDGIRGIAILGVLATHAAVEHPGLGLGGYSRLVRYVFTPGWAGVDLFFVLSGFLITGILLSTKASSNYFKSFYARRCLRIWPIYYVTLLGLVTGATLFPSLGAVVSRPGPFLTSYFLYLQNIPAFLWHGKIGMLMGPFWSLAVEEQFYLIWPVLVLLLSERALGWVCALGFIVAITSRAYMVHVHPDDIRTVMLTTSRLDGLVVGAACALFMHVKKRPVPLVWITAAFCIGAGIIGYIAIFHCGELLGTSFYMYTIGITGFALLSGSLVAISQHRFPLLQRPLTMSLLRGFGKYSYGIYVYHKIVFVIGAVIMQQVFRWELPVSLPLSLIAIAAMTAATFGVAKLSYDHFEMRFLSLKRYFEPVAEKPAMKSTAVTARCPCR
jgi:peptidoglycan/LPS O-acetylase OafA/YrhL